MATTETFDCEAEVTCLKTHVAEVKEQLDSLNDRVCVLEEAADDPPFTPGTFAFAADTGTNDLDQTQAANLVLGWDVDALLLGGDNNYPSGAAATIEDAFSNFSSLVDAGKVYPAMGNHDLDTLDGGPLMDKFPGLFVVPDSDPAVQRRYYHQHFTKGDLDLFVLDSGENTAGSLVEPDGNTVGSAQYQWFIDQLAASTGRWKIVMFHHPFVTPVDTTPDRFLLEMNWGFESLGIDLVLWGHNHSVNHIRANGLNCLDASAFAAARDNDVTLPNLYGATTGAYSVFIDESGASTKSLPAVARINIQKYKLSVELFEVASGTLVHEFVV